MDLLPLTPQDQYATNGSDKSPGTQLLTALAARGNVAQTLKLLFQVTGTATRTQVGICLHFLSKPSVSSVLAEWALDDTDAESLLKLSAEIRSSPQLLTEFPLVPASKRMAQQFRGTVDEQQLLLMMAVRRPGREPELQAWFDSLRTWVLLEGIALAKICGGREKNIELVASKIRQAGDGDTNWLQFVERLQGPADRFESLSRHLRWSSRRLIAQADGEPLRFLRKVEHVANGETPSPVSPVAPASEFLSALLDLPEIPPSAPPTDAPVNWSWEPAASEDDELPPPDQKTNSIAVGVEKDLSFSEQMLAGRGVMLRSAEQLQFLLWSWDKPTPDENAALHQLFVDWDRSSSPKLRLLAFLARIAIKTSRSMRLAESLPVSDLPGADWSVTADLRKLHRLPPRKRPGWRADESHLEWIRPLLDVFRIDLKPLLLEPDPQQIPWATLGDLWRQCSPDETAEVAFNQMCRAQPALQRISSGMLCEVFAARLFQLSSDAVLAQLVSSGPRAGLGGSSAYASWPARKIGTMLSTDGISIDTRGCEDFNFAGSELDPLDTALRQSISDAQQKVVALASDPARWIAHHNALTAYVVTALFAATGGRPVSDPFQSPKLFDWNKLRVFIADKVSARRSGRLVPIPAAVMRLLQETYCQHLLWISIQLRESAPSLAAEIALLAARQESQHLPFFFFLKGAPCLSWESVSEASLSRLELVNWPLPWNLMRHRLSIRLREAMLDPELIDSLLGHADQGVMTHGDESPRVWLHDMLLRPSKSKARQPPDIPVFLRSFPGTPPVPSRDGAPTR